MTMEITDSLALPQVKGAGPVTQAVKRRALFVYLAIVFVGWALTLSGSSFLSGFGLGLFFPGSGFVYAGSWLSLVLTLVLFAVAFLVWFASGNILAPAGVWLLAALLAGVFASGEASAQLLTSAVWIVPGVVVVMGLVLRAKNQQSYKRELEVYHKRNAYLSETPVAPVLAPSFDSDYWQEASLDDLKALRFNFNRALQPLDEFNGFEWHEFQFQFAAVRYQMNVLNYGLHLYQQRYVPNFHGYLSEAQRNLIEKMLNKRVWGYWRWEALWGQLTTDFDPIKKENVMLSGWWGVNVAAYTATTGDQRYLQPGSLTFRYDDKEFPYDLHSVAKAVHQNYVDSKWCLYACEPNWVYNMCNSFGMNFLKQHDTQFGTQYYADIEKRLLDSFQNEFTTVDGRVIALRSQRLGFSVPLLTSPMADAQFGYVVNAVAPKMAQRVWKILRTDLSRMKEDGSVEIDTKGWDEVDLGNYKPSNLTTYLIIRFFAKEMGDTEFADALERDMLKQHDLVEEEGVRYFSDGSVTANGQYTIGNMGHKNGWSDLVGHKLPETVMQGPVLDECRYPDVLVAKAVSLDGKSLDLIVYPGSKQYEQELGISRLVPGQTYQIAYNGEATNHEADAEGRLRAKVKLDGRTPVTLTPASR